jgi:hypothetical protein
MNFIFYVMYQQSRQWSVFEKVKVWFEFLALGYIGMT